MCEGRGRHRKAAGPVYTGRERKPQEGQRQAVCRNRKVLTGKLQSIQRMGFFNIYLKKRYGHITKAVMGHSEDDSDCFTGRHHTAPLERNLLWLYCPHAGLKETNRADRPAGKAAITSVLCLGRSEVLRSLRHYMRAQNQVHHTIDRLEERGLKRGSALKTILKGRERAIISQTNIGTVSKATFGKLLRDVVERIITGYHQTNT